MYSIASKISLLNCIKFFKIMPFSIILIYALIPFESSNPRDALLIRCIAASILITILCWGRLNISKKYVRYVNYFIIISPFILIAVVNSFSLKFFIVLISFILAYVWGLNLLNSTKKSGVIIDALKVIIYASIITLLIQILTFRFGYFINFHEILFPWSSVRFEEHLSFSRLGGLYIEPGTYANWVYALFVFLIFSIRRIPAMLGCLVGLSMIFTISVWGILVGSLVAMLAVITAKNVHLVGKIFAIVLVLMVFMYFFTGDIETYFATKMSFVTGSGNAKIIAYSEVKAIWQELIFFGEGFDPLIASGHISIQDAGIVVNLTVVYGFLFVLLLFFPIYFYAYKLGGFLNIILVTPLLATKLFYWDFLFYLIFATALSGLVKSRNIEK